MRKLTTTEVIELTLLLGFMVVAWSANFIIAKYALREIPPFALLFTRVWMSTIILIALYFLRGRHRTHALQRGDWKWFAWLGFLGVAMNQTGFTVGIHYTTVGHASLIFGMGPILVLVLAVWMKLEHMTLRKTLGLTLSFLGAAILASEHGLTTKNPTLIGDMIIVGGVVAFSLYTTFGKKVGGRYDTLTLNTFTYIAGALVVTPLAGWQILRVDWGAVTWRGWLGAAYMAGIASVTAYMIFYYALTKISATRISTLAYLQPILATSLAVIFLGENVTGHLIGGGALIFLGVYLAQRGDRFLQTTPPAD
jgi:drug/metabolite transporter (DMT)-like permease